MTTTETTTALEHRDDIDAWLDGNGFGLTQFTDATLAAAYQALDLIDARYPQGDLVNLAKVCAVSVLLSAEPDQLVNLFSRVWKKTREQEERARMRATGAIIAAVVRGDSENGLAKRTGISRPTIRKALGKKG